LGVFACELHSFLLLSHFLKFELLLIIGFLQRDQFVSSIDKLFDEVAALLETYEMEVCFDFTSSFLICCNSLISLFLELSIATFT
jgi:hypothetical protein